MLNPLALVFVLYDQRLIENCEGFITVPKSILLVVLLFGKFDAAFGVPNLSFTNVILVGIP